MLNKEKVIKGLYAHGYKDCKSCPYWGTGNNGMSDCRQLAREAYALLKEQEAIKPYMDYDGQDVWRCGKCGNSLMHPSYYESDEDAKKQIRYCSHCGQEVKWE